MNEEYNKLEYMAPYQPKVAFQISAFCYSCKKAMKFKNIDEKYDTDEFFWVCPGCNTITRIYSKVD